MPTFDTPAPIHARIDLAAGSVRIHAGERSDTVVEVRPAKERSTADQQAAEQTRVEYSEGTLRVRSTRKPRLLFFNSGPGVDVDVFLPEGSRLDVNSPAGDVECDGRLGDVTVNCRYGDIRIDRTATVHASTATGDISVDLVDGSAEASTAYGGIRIGRAVGELRLTSACGDITVDQACSSVGASTKYGEVRVREAMGGSLELETAYGRVEAGVSPGTAAWLDVQSASGTVKNLMTAFDAPTESEDTVRIRARTAYGDIVIRRA
jgi:DUF4097 and DUF4098 domain-containing protein YvlB